MNQKYILKQRSKFYPQANKAMNENNAVNICHISDKYKHTFLRTTHRDNTFTPKFETFFLFCLSEAAVRIFISIPNVL